MNMWHEKYRPKNSLNEYFGNQTVVQVTVNWINSVIKGKPIGDGLLYHGPPGTGKTSLTQVISNEHDLPFIQCNASDDRNRKQIKKYVDAGISKPFGKKVSFLILDEVEAINIDLVKLIKHTNPILISNDKYKIDKKARNMLFDLEFSYPSKSEKLKYAKFILKNEDKKLDNNIINNVVENSKNFRSVAKNLQIAVLGIDDEIIDDVTEYGLYEEVSKLCKGEHKGRASIRPRELLTWVLDNGGNPALVSQLDRILGQTPRNDYRSWKYVYDLVQFAGVDDEIEYPHFIRFLSKYRNYG